MSASPEVVRLHHHWVRHLRQYYLRLPRRGRRALILLVSSALLLQSADLIWPVAVPDPLTLTASGQQDFAQLVVDRYDRPLRAFADANGVWRYPLTPDQVSAGYLQALLTYEDRWFYWHPGINPLALIRAAWQNWRCDCVVSGGSTITMQVARRFHPHSRSLAGKLQQALRALQLEWHYSKAEILTLYLNYAPMGGVIEGVGAASRLYLDKSPHDLSLAESALLAVLPQAPSHLRPDRHPLRAQQARNKVLRRLRDFSAISEQEYQQALLEPVLAYEPQTPQLAPLLARRLREQHPQQSLIRTTLDADLQFQLEDFLRQEIQQYPPAHSAAVLVLDNASHEVRAYAGSADFTDNSRFGHVDMVQALRSPGSAMKPFIYGLAIEQGLIHSASLLRDVPRYLKDYQPENFTSHFSGPVSATEALQRSLNLPAVQVLEALTPQVFDSALRNAGIRYRIPGGKPNLAMALGGGGLSLADLTALFSSLINDGQVFPLRYERPASVPLTSRWLMSPASAWVTAGMLHSPRPDRVRSHAVRQQEARIAWKTGTSYGFRDAWALGTTPEYTIGVWFGRPDGTPSPGHYGAVSALPVLFKLFDRIDPQPQAQPQPDQVTQTTICWPLGRAAAGTPAGQCLRALNAFLVRQQIPPTLPDSSTDGLWRNPLRYWTSERGLLVDSGCHVAQHTGHSIALWPRSLEPWVPLQQRLRQQLPAADPRCPEPPLLALEPLQIIGLSAGSRMRSSRSRNGGSLIMPEIALKALGGRGSRDWFIDGVYIASAGEEQSISYRFTATGDHEVVVMDQSGELDRRTVLVE